MGVLVVGLGLINRKVSIFMTGRAFEELAGFQLSALERRKNTLKI